MLGRIVLVVLQLVVGWFATPEVLRYVPAGGDAQIFTQGAAAGVIVWLVGFVAAPVLRIAWPTPAALAAALVGGLLGAALVVYGVPHLLPVGSPPLLWLLLPETRVPAKRSRQVS